MSSSSLPDVNAADKGYIAHFTTAIERNYTNFFSWSTGNALRVVEPLTSSTSEFVFESDNVIAKTARFAMTAFLALAALPLALCVTAFDAVVQTASSVKNYFSPTIIAKEKE